MDGKQIVGDVYQTDGWRNISISLKIPLPLTILHALPVPISGVPLPASASPAYPALQVSAVLVKLLAIGDPLSDPDFMH